MSTAAPPINLDTRVESPPHGVGFAEFALALGGFALGTGEFASMGLLPNVARDIHVSVPVAGHMISAYALGVVIGAPLLAAAFARSGRRAMLVGLMGFFAIANLLCAVASSYGLVVAARFLAGLPHGAYFGIASIVAASLVPPNKRAQAVARMMLGLSSANVVGVPFATWVGQMAGWRAAFVVVAVIGLATAILCRIALRPMPAPEGASPLTELSALARGQVWLTLGIAAIGFGGVFAVYSYITPMLVFVTGMTEAAVPPILSVIGVGMVAGSLFGGWLADKGVMRAVAITLSLNVVVLALVAVTVHNVAAVTVNMFFMGFAALSIGPALQTRLMDVAQDAQALAAALNHSAFNFANALGAWLGGVAIAAGMGWTSTGPIGALLALGGLAIWFVAWRSGGPKTAAR
ncbi:MFS transporter [Sphingomonas montanisoli]|uniref:MFS transporter n=1 Tax=Sphingomonas montanisoli TaxID=2606412 RepID=A0A5D9CFZ7_9SPHN|nr:MFS transporter [Sphingomonas montanisoli]TZG28985.1 MFS transporter [Sphingomonas montanisoli]